MTVAYALRAIVNEECCLYMCIYIYIYKCMYVCVIKLLGGKYDLAVSLSTFKFHLPLHEGM